MARVLLTILLSISLFCSVYGQEDSSTSVPPIVERNPANATDSVAKTDEVVIESSFIRQLDKALEPNIAATLAGLSLAALIFAVSLIPAQSNEHYQSTQKIIGGAFTAEAKDELVAREKGKLDKITSAAEDLKLALFSFITFLALTFSVDILASPDNLSSKISAAEYLDVAISGSALAFGVFKITLGAKKIGEAILKASLN